MREICAYEAGGDSSSSSSAPPRAIEHDSGVSYTACSFFYMHDPICSPFIVFKFFLILSTHSSAAAPGRVTPQKFLR